MKVGDKFICIRNNNGHSVGKFYDIKKLSVNEVELDVNEGTSVKIHDRDFNVISRMYYLISPIDKCSYFYDYFADSKRLRKIKLNKINESR